VVIVSADSSLGLFVGAVILAGNWEALAVVAVDVAEPREDVRRQVEE
jgi:hypothetical protein